MSPIDANPSDNGRAPDGWSSSWTHFQIDRPSASYCRVTFMNPPINVITATTVVELTELMGLIETDADLNVVVFDSANPDFYLADYDAAREPGSSAAPSRGPTGLHAWLDLLRRLSRAPVVSIASVRDVPAAPEASSSSLVTFASPRARTRCSAASKSE